MNDIQREFLYIIAIFILCTLGVYKLGEIVVFAWKQLPANAGIVFLLFFIALMFKLKYDAYKRKGGQ